MMEIYQAAPLIKHTVQIECITSYDDKLLLGTRQGHLLMYNLVKTSEDKADVQVMRYNKTFSKKPILQLEVIPEHNILISLTDNIIQAHDINAFNFPTIFTLSKSRGATLFTIDATKTGDTTNYYLCVAVKRKLQLYKWTNREFESFGEDINLVEVPKSLAWCQNAICVGCKGEYYCYKIEEKSTLELFPTSSNRSTEPYVVKASDNTFSLVRENQTVLINNKGEAQKSKLLKWSDIPIALIWDDPYCIALLENSAEIQSIESGGLIQTIPEMPKVRFISCAKQGLLYAASISQVWVLEAIDIALQRKLLLENKQFQLALTLTSVSKESDEEKKEIIYEIETHLAYDLFAKKQFSRSMNDFLKLGTNPSDVIRLFPDLLPQQSKSESETTTSDFTPRELEEGLQALIDYLTTVRLNQHLKAQDIKATGNLNEQAVVNKTNQQLLQIIDTTLLKCYLQTNDALVAPLLRSNHCHLAETERTLKKYGKDTELMILYQTKGQHRRALELLKSKESIDRTIGYLQHLGANHMGLILEFAEWVLIKAPDEGIKIFTEDLIEVEGLHRPRILDYLLRSHASRVIPYLEHVVETWKDPNPLFHNALIHKYREMALSDDPCASLTRAKLLKFLESSENYKPDTVLMHFPTDDLLVERAIILGKLGSYEQSLAIFVRALGDIERAIEYCNKIYSKGRPGSQNIFITLIQLILNPDSIPLSLTGVVLSPKTAQPDLETALKILGDYASCINPLSILSVLPQNIPVSRIYKFLQVALHDNLKERRRVQLLKGLLYAEHLQSQEMRLHLENQKVLITDLNTCPVCKKRFGNQSALVRYPNGDVVHYSCQDK